MNTVSGANITTNLPRLGVGSGTDATGPNGATGQTGQANKLRTYPYTDGTGATSDTSDTTSTTPGHYDVDGVATSIQTSNDYRELARDLMAGNIAAAQKDEAKLHLDLAATNPQAGSINAAVAAFTANSPSNSGTSPGSSLSVTV